MSNDVCNIESTDPDVNEINSDAFHFRALLHLPEIKILFRINKKRKEGLLRFLLKIFCIPICFVKKGN